MNALLHLLRTHWKAVVLVMIVLLLLPAVVAALKAAEEVPGAVVAPLEESGEPAVEPIEQPLPVPDEPSQTEPGQAEPRQAEPVLEAGSVTQPFAAYREMIERPLFSSTRRPPVLKDAPQDSLDGQQLREAWRLSGVVLEQGRQLASFSERSGEQRLLLEAGMVLADEWRLERIASDHVLLSNGASEVRLPLREPVAAAPPGEPGAAPAAQVQPQAAPTNNTSPTVDTPAVVPAQ